MRTISVGSVQTALASRRGVFSSSAAQPKTSPFFRICVGWRACAPGPSVCLTWPETMM